MDTSAEATLSGFVQWVKEHLSGDEKGRPSYSLTACSRPSGTQALERRVQLSRCEFRSGHKGERPLQTSSGSPGFSLK